MISALKYLVTIALILLPALACHAQEKKPDYASKPLEKWIELLKKGGSESCEQAKAALGPDGPYSEVAIPALLEAFAAKEPPGNSWDFLEVLVNYGPDISPILIRALKRPEESVRVAAIDTLRMIRPKAVDAVPALLEAMNDPSPDVRVAAATSLGSIKQPLEKTIPALVAALRDEEYTVRGTAANVLNRLKSKAKPALPALIVLLKDKEVSVRDAAAGAIMNIGPDAKIAVPTLIEGFSDKKNGSRVMFAQALGGIGPSAKDAVPALIVAVQDRDEMIWRWAMSALSDIGPGAAAAVPVLIAAAKDKSNSDRSGAIRALGCIGPQAKAAIPLLIEFLVESKSYRSYAATALGGIGPAAKEAIPKLVEMARNRLDDDSYSARQAAAEAVMKIDPEYGAKEGIELAYLNVRLGKIPAVKLATREALTEEKKKQIKKLIADLAGLTEPDFGLSATLTGSAFASLPDREHFAMGIITDHRLKTSNAFRRLVEIGPDALPFLLQALENTTPTKLKAGGGGMTFFSSEMESNPLNSWERRALSEKSKPNVDEESDDSDSASYTLRVGDVCFVAIGQIVGRKYSAVRYQPTALVLINSPVESKAFRQRIRAVWSSENTTQKMLESLLIDFTTESIFNGKNLNGWYEGSDRQIEAAMRLLYYFPKESVPLIVDRLKRMDVNSPKKQKGGWMKREVANGVRTTDFLKALSWCKEPAVGKVLLDIFERTDDPQVSLAVLPAVSETHGELVANRLRALLKALPPSGDSELGDGHDLLLAVSKYAGKIAKSEFEKYLIGGSMQRIRTMCYVVEEVHGEWAMELLGPILTDKRADGSSLRICDRAASTLSRIHPELKFEFQETPEENDRQIDEMRKQIALKKGK